jgi:hypothetical protein
MREREEDGGERVRIGRGGRKEEGRREREGKNGRGEGQQEG